MSDDEVYDGLLTHLESIANDDFEIKSIFQFCATSKCQRQLLDYIESGNTDRKQVILMASQISIENGISEGELEED